MTQTKQQQAGLGRYGDAYFIIKLQISRSFPIFFGQKDLDQGMQMDTFGILKHAVMGDIASNYFYPGDREGHFSEFFSAALAKPIKHTDFLFF